MLTWKSIFVGFASTTLLAAALCVPPTGWLHASSTTTPGSLNQDDNERKARAEAEEEEENEWIGELQELEEEMLHLEFERSESETSMLHLESVEQIARIADNQTMLTAYTISRLTDVMEPEEAIQTLEQIMGTDRPSSVFNLARIRLIDLYLDEDRPEDARRIVKTLLHVQ